MSWEAVKWANEQRLRLPQEQLVLLVLANCADPEGIAFSWWKRKEHWWNYLVEHTRLSRASVFRHLNTIEELGLGIRQKLVLSDGSVRFTMILDLTKRVIAEALEKDSPDDQSHGETHENADTQSHGETAPVSLVRLHKKESDSESSRPPNPPPGGVQAIDEDLEQDLAEAIRTYPDPITDLPRLRTVMGAMAPPERKRVLLGMSGYAAYIRGLEAKGKTRAVKDAHRWVAAGMHEGYVAAGEKAAVAARQVRVAVDSPEGRAWANLRRIGQAVGPREFAGEYLLSHFLSPQELAFADPPPEAEWHMLTADHDRQALAAWGKFFTATLDGNRGTLIREHYRKGERIVCALLPWYWPPRKDGTVTERSEDVEPQDSPASGCFT